MGGFEGEKDDLEASGLEISGVTRSVALVLDMMRAAEFQTSGNLWRDL